MVKTGLTFSNDSFSIKQSPKGIRVTDGAGTITAPYSSGKITYVRSDDGGILYVNGKMVGRHFSPNTSHSSKSIYTGCGDIKNIKIWNHALTDEQMYHFS